MATIPAPLQGSCHEAEQRERSKWAGGLAHVRSYSLSQAQLERIEPYFPRSHGRPRVGDRRMISGMVHVIRDGSRWRDAPEIYGPRETLYNRFTRWSRIGVFRRILESLV